MYPTQSVAQTFSTVTELCQHYGVNAPLWTAFTNVIGDPQQDIKLVAVLPSKVVGAALARALLPDGTPLSAVQASQVGLVWNLAKRIMHTRGGGDWDAWTELSPFADGTPASSYGSTQAPPLSTPPVIEKKVKMASIIDQHDETEVIVEGEGTKAAWFQQYLQTVGGWPPEEEEPTPEQVSAVAKRINIQGIAPYVDMAIFTPYGHRTQRAAKFRTYILTAGGYTAKELPGPSNFIQWRTCFRVLRTTLIMLDAVSLSALRNYEMAIERLARTYPTAWHLIYAADDMARSTHANRVKAKVTMDVKSGKAAPSSWDPGRPLGLRVPILGHRRELLESTSPLSGFGVDCHGIQRHTQDTRRATGHGKLAGWSQCHHTRDGQGLANFVHERPGEEHPHEGSKRCEEKTGEIGQGGTSTSSGRHQEKSQRSSTDQAAMLWLEQWQWAMCWIAAWTNVRVNREEGPSLHKMQVTRPPFERLSPEDGLISNGDGKSGGDEGSKRESTSSSSSYTSTSSSKKEPNKEGEEPNEGDKKEDTKDPGDLDPKPHKARSVEEYLQQRKFLFVHHFAGTNDPLSAAMRNEAAKVGITLEVVSVELMSGTGDLTAAEPYNTHLRWANQGLIDCYHSGFPCSTFSRLRLRPAEGLPGPVRSREEPYGLAGLSEAQQLICDQGTVMASRSINMARAVALNSTNESKVPPVSTLENPPESDDPRHLSAWELPEMKRFLEIRPRTTARFNTCAFEPHLPVGQKHYKPQRFDGTLLGMQLHCRKCTCGSPQNHDTIVGASKSKASGEYPAEFCKVYAKLAVEQMVLRAKEEYLKGRMTTLSKTIEFHKQLLADKSNPHTPPLKAAPASPPGPPRKKSNRSRTPLPRSKGKPDDDKESGRRSTTRRDHNQERASSSGLRRSRTPRRESTVTLVPNKETISGDHSWQGGEGNYGKLRGGVSRAKSAASRVHVGGMKDPYKVVTPMSNLLSLGLRIRAAWETFVRECPKATEVSESYGTMECTIGPKVVGDWKARLKKVLGAKAPPKLKMASKYEYKSNLEAEMLDAWRIKGNDPECHVPEWIRAGTPLGINVPIPTAGVFPSMESELDLNHVQPEELEDAAAQLQRGAINNYVSVRENPGEAEIEIQRYREAGFLRDIPKETVTKEMASGTISKLGLILKTKPDGSAKRRIILDLRRSGGNRKALTPRKIGSASSL